MIITDQFLACSLVRTKTLFLYIFSDLPGIFYLSTYINKAISRIGFQAFFTNVVTISFDIFIIFLIFLLPAPYNF
jgi:hypothetical protein